MNKSLAKRIGIGIALLFLLLVFIAALYLWSEVRKAASEDPLVWESDISELEQQVAPGPAPVVFIGSSSIRMWSTLVEDMRPLPVLNMGFGGAKLNDVAHFAPRLVNRFNPAAVVVFAGSNDLQPGDTKTPEQLLQRYQSFVQSVRVDNPALPIFYIAITPSPMRWEVWSEVQAVNRAIADWSRNQTELFYIDTSPSLLNTEGVPDTGLYLFDGLHLNAKGYKRWADLIRPMLFTHPGIAQLLK